MHLLNKVHTAVILGDKHKRLVKMSIDSTFQRARSQVKKLISIFYCHNEVHFKH